MASTDNKNNLMVVFADERPDALFYETIFDPDIDGTGYMTVEEAENATGKIIPKPGSLAIKKELGELYYVVSVDAVTYKSTLKPCRFVMTDDSGNDLSTSIIDYGNDRFMLYWDDRVRPTKLVIDSKLVIYGAANTEYRLVRYITDPVTGLETEQIISIYLNPDDQFDGNRIPLAEIGGLIGAKYPTNCHTNFEMVDGDLIYLEVYNNVGILSARVTLHSKRATILNDLASAANPIMHFDAKCLQMRGDEWYIYERQDPSHLGITPYVEYSNNTKRDLVVDNNSVIIYGLDEFIPSFPGYKHKLLFKYYLNAKEQSPIAIVGGRHRYLTCEKDLVVINSDSDDYSLKISCYPIWDNASVSYKLKFWGYGTDRDKMYDLTDLINIETTWDGRLFYHEQKVTYNLDLSTVFGTNSSLFYRQSSWITLFPNNTYQKYILKDSANADKAYGAESSESRRPVLHYDTTLQQYFIPTSIFGNIEAFLDAFYYMANPPFNTYTGETVPLVPTHFTVRSIDTGNVIIMTPIEIEQYSQAFNIVLNGSANQLVNGTVVIEFLRKQGDVYKILYGVPVDVYQSVTGYNTETNP